MFTVKDIFSKDYQSSMELDLLFDLEYYLTRVPTLHDDEFEAYVTTLAKLRDYLRLNFRPFIKNA